MSDFRLENYTSMVLFVPLSDAARAKTAELGLEPWQMLGSDGMFAIDHRPARFLIEQLLDEGFDLGRTFTS
jgi:hypothetical protein